MKAIRYNMRQARKQWKRRQGRSSTDVLYNIARITPGFYTNVLEQQRQAYKK